MKPKVLAYFVLAVLMSVAAPSASAQDDDSYQIGLSTDLPEGDFVAFKGDRFDVNFSPNYDSYVSVLALDKKGNVRVIFPNRRQRDNSVRAGDELHVRDIYCDYTGPVYIEAVAVYSEDFGFRYGDDRNPFWNERWGDFDPYRSFLADRRGSFTLSFDESGGRRPPILGASYDESRLASELKERIDSDYESFEEQVRDFRDQIYEVVGRESWTSSYVDVYVADDKYNAASYEEDSESSEYEAPTYASYYDYGASQFDYEMALEGYGTWVDMRGIRVWRPPAFTMGWRPFCNGYWTWTSYGWYWVGYEPFAWVVYHYGYWQFDPFYGWYWIPDYWRYRFTAANCVWYQDASYIGWYPAPPPSEVAVRMNLSVNVNFDFARAVVVDKRNFLHADISAVAVAPERAASMMVRAQPRFDLKLAPKPAELEKVVGTHIVETHLQRVEKPAKLGGAKVEIVKPVEMKPAPRAFQELDQKTKKEVMGKPHAVPHAAPGAAPAAPPAKKIERPQLAPPPAVRERPKHEGPRPSAPLPPPQMKPHERPPTEAAPQPPPRHGKPPEEAAPPPRVKPGRETPEPEPRHAKPPAPPEAQPRRGKQPEAEPYTPPAHGKRPPEATPPPKGHEAAPADQGKGKGKQPPADEDKEKGKGKGKQPTDEEQDEHKGKGR